MVKNKKGWIKIIGGELMIKNKKGWIKIFEAFLAVSLLMGFLLIILGQVNSLQEKGIDPLLLKTREIAREIQINETLYEEVLGQNNLPIFSNSSGFSEILKEYINKYPGCAIGICEIDENCFFTEDFRGEVYSIEKLIFCSEDVCLERKLNVFCVKNEN